MPPTFPAPRVTAAPPGTPYHRLARTDRHRWWRPPLGTLMLVGVWLLGIAAVLLVAVVVALVTGTLDAVGPALSTPRRERSPQATLAILGASLALEAVAIPAILLAARVVGGRPAGTLSAVTGRLRWRWLVVCLGLAVPVMGVALGATYLLPAPGGAAGAPGASDPGWVGWGRFLVAAAVFVALVPLQSAAEEYAFRGWVLQSVCAYVRTPWAGIVPAAVLFALAHGLGTAWGFADLVLFGLVVGWLATRTGGLESAIALHTVNNALALLTAAALGILDATQTAASATWRVLAVDVVALPLYAAVVVLLSRRMGILRTVPGPAE